VEARADVGAECQLLRSKVLPANPAAQVRCDAIRGRRRRSQGICRPGGRTR
jgi:hypothetical protein